MCHFQTEELKAHIQFFTILWYDFMAIKETHVLDDIATG